MDEKNLNSVNNSVPSPQFGSNLMRDLENRERLSADFVADRKMLESSSLFDRDLYQERAGLSTTQNAAEHYLLIGWKLGMEPCQNFEGNFLYPYFCSIGLDGAPALTYLTIQAAGWPVYPTRASVERIAERIRSSEWFEPASYSKRADCGDLDPLLHYLIVGEQIGHPPSDLFDPAYYRARYADVEASGSSALHHFMCIGRINGRRPASIASELVFDTSRIDPKRETILLIIRQASRAGTSVLAYELAIRLSKRYNVVALLLSSGDLVDDLKHCCAAVIGPLGDDIGSGAEADQLAKHLIRTYPVSYAIANGIDTRSMLRSLTCAFVPTIALVHEFASYLKPSGEMGRALDWATQIVFSAPSAAASALSEYFHLENRVSHILVHGPTKPPRTHSGMSQPKQKMVRRLIRRPFSAGQSFVVVGCGAMSPRQGIDLFLSCASAVAAWTPKQSIRFVWLGSPASGYISAILSYRIFRLGLRDTACIVNDVADFESVYASADLFLLTSRLEPLANGALEAMERGIPIVCFSHAEGVADLLSTDPAASMGIVPDGDVNAAARTVIELSQDDAKRNELKLATRRLAEITFNMDQYAHRIDGLGRHAVSMMDQRKRDFETIMNDPMFDVVNFLGEGVSPVTRGDSIRWFLGRAAAMGTGTMPTGNFYYRRPSPGFHPQIYALENLNQYDAAKINPLAHFIRSGKPEGPWRHEVIAPSRVREPSTLRIALHGHFFYTDLFDDFLQKLRSNRTHCDLFLSTTDDEKASKLCDATVGYDRGTVVVRLVPNRGRDIGPLLTEFGDELSGYDLVGHVHSKRSLHSSDAAEGSAWREFLWQNMLGDIFPMMDVIAHSFSENDKLGLVFADDPHLGEWAYNRDLAEKLALRMGIEDALPRFFNYPIGTMFWIRPKALAPLCSLRLRWEDYPQEPVGVDGTLLHAVERLLPFSAGRAGYRYATTHIEGITW